MRISNKFWWCKISDQMVKSKKRMPVVFFKRQTCCFLQNFTPPITFFPPAFFPSTKVGCKIKRYSFILDGTFKKHIFSMKPVKKTSFFWFLDFREKKQLFVSWARFLVRKKFEKIKKRISQKERTKVLIFSLTVQDTVPRWTSCTVRSTISWRNQLKSFICEFHCNLRITFCKIGFLFEIKGHVILCVLGKINSVASQHFFYSKHLLRLHEIEFHLLMNRKQKSCAWL